MAGSRLLALPRELQDIVLEYVVLGEATIRLHRTTGAAAYKTFNSHAPIILTNRQLHLEYFDVLRKTVLAAESNVDIIASIDTTCQARTRDLTFFAFQLSNQEIAIVNEDSKLYLELFSSPASRYPYEGVMNALQLWFECSKRIGLQAQYIINSESASSAKLSADRRCVRRFSKLGRSRSSRRHSTRC